MAESDKKDVAWYQAEIGGIPAPVRKLFETYSGIAPDRVEPHILEVVGGMAPFREHNDEDIRLIRSTTA